MHFCSKDLRYGPCRLKSVGLFSFIVFLFTFQALAHTEPPLAPLPEQIPVEATVQPDDAQPSLAQPGNFLEAFSWPHEERLSRKRLRLDAESVVEMEDAFVRILNQEFEDYYYGNRDDFLADIRKGLIGVYRDKQGKIRSYRDLYDAKLYSSGSSGRNGGGSDGESVKENPASRVYERITARTLNSNERPKQRIIVGKYSPMVEGATRTARELECPVVLVNLPLTANSGHSMDNYSESLRRMILSLQMNDGLRSVTLTFNEANEVTGGFYTPQIKPINTYDWTPNGNYFTNWFRSKYVKPDWRHVKLALLSALIHFASGVAITFAFKPDNFHIVPAIANGLFTLLICSHSKTYENVVKSKARFAYFWETFKRLLIALPLGTIVAGINAGPNHAEVLLDPHIWYQVTLISYLDRFLSTSMNRIPRWRDATGMSAGDFKFTIAGRTFETELPGDSTEREIPAILRNIPKFISYLFVSGAALIPDGTLLLLGLVPVAETVNHFWLKANADRHPKIAAEYERSRRRFNIPERLEALRIGSRRQVARMGDALQSLRDPQTLMKKVGASVDSLKRRCAVGLAALGF